MSTLTDGEKAKKRCAIYARVSTRDQNPTMQIEELRRYAAARGWAVAGEFADRGESGAKEQRPRLEALMLAARRRELDAVLVWKFDRFARSLRHLVVALDEFSSLGIDFVSYTEAVDTSSPVGRVVFAVVGAMAELERSLNQERTRAGLDSARRRGRRLGRPRLAVDPDRVRALRGEGWSWARISSELRQSESTLRRALVIQ